MIFLHKMLIYTSHTSGSISKKYACLPEVDPVGQEVREYLLFTSFLFHLEMITVVQTRGGGSLLYHGLKLGIDSICEGCEPSSVLVRLV